MCSGSRRVVLQGRGVLGGVWDILDTVRTRRKHVIMLTTLTLEPMICKNLTLQISNRREGV